MCDLALAFVRSFLQLSIAATRRSSFAAEVMGATAGNFQPYPLDQDPIQRPGQGSVPLQITVDLSEQTTSVIYYY